jgi:ceramide glucosyltransferase
MSVAAPLVSVFGWLVLALAMIGTVYWAYATYVLARFLEQRRSAPTSGEAVTLLKPLYGAEPRLEAAALQTVGAKGWDGLLVARVTDQPG